MDRWSDFYVAQAGASAALAGLLFVGISISLADILKFPHLPMRAAGAMTLLAGVLVLAVLMLVPDQTIRDAGQSVLGFGIVIMALTAAMGVASLRKTPAEFKREAFVIIGIKLVAAGLFVVSGAIMTITGDRGAGLIVTGCIVSYIVAFTDAWVLLVEVHR